MPSSNLVDSVMFKFFKDFFWSTHWLGKAIIFISYPIFLFGIGYCLWMGYSQECRPIFGIFYLLLLLFVLTIIYFFENEEHKNDESILLGTLFCAFFAIIQFLYPPSFNSREYFERNLCWSFFGDKDFLFKRSVLLGIHNSLVRDKPKLGFTFKGEIEDISDLEKPDYGERNSSFTDGLKIKFRKVTFNKTELNITRNPRIDSKLTFVDFPYKKDFKKMPEEDRFHKMGNTFLNFLVVAKGLHDEIAVMNDTLFQKPSLSKIEFDKLNIDYITQDGSKIHVSLSDAFQGPIEERNSFLTFDQTVVLLPSWKALIFRKWKNLR